MRFVSILASLVLSGCTLATLIPMQHAGDGLRSAHRVGPPRRDRCAAQPPKDAKTCAELRDRALTFVRRLSVDDQVCLLGNPLMDGVTQKCRVRAFVEDAGPSSVKLEIREASPDSSFVQMDDYWYHEAALADLQLRQSGFGLPEEPPAK